MQVEITPEQAICLCTLAMIALSGRDPIKEYSELYRLGRKVVSNYTCGVCGLCLSSVVRLKKGKGLICRQCLKNKIIWDE